MQEKVREAEGADGEAIEEEIMERARKDGIYEGEIIPGTLNERYTREIILCEYWGMKADCIKHIKDTRVEYSEWEMTPAPISAAGYTPIKMSGDGVN